jgi:hypothetical protein
VLPLPVLPPLAEPTHPVLNVQMERQMYQMERQAEFLR